MNLIRQWCLEPGPPLPTKTYTTLVPKLEKYPPFADSRREKHPFFNRNRWFWGPIKHPFLKQNAILFSLYKMKYLFVKAILIVSNIFLCTSYFSLCLIWNEHLNTHPRSNVWKPEWKQADTCKMFTLFQNFADLCLKNYPFFAPTFEILPLSSRMWVRAWYAFWPEVGGRDLELS